MKRHGLLPLLLISPTLALAAAPGFDNEFELRLDHLEATAMRDPQAALQSLPALAELPEARGRGARLRFAEGRIQLQAGNMAAVARLADQLEGDAAGKIPSDALRAALAERQGQLNNAAKYAQATLDALGSSCDLAVPLTQQSTPASAVQNALRETPAALPKSCDVSSALIALSIMEDDQFNRGLLPKSAELAQTRLALARAAEREIDIVQTLGDFAMLEFARDHISEAQQWAQHARTQAGQDPLLLAFAKTYEANLARRMGNKAAQARAQLDGLTLAREAGAPSLIARAQSNLADYYMQEREPARALALLDEALPALQKLNDQARERTVRHNLAVTLIQLKRFPQARQELAKVDELRRGQPDVTRRVNELRELDQAWADAGQPKEAITLFHEERRLTEEANSRNRESLLSELKVKYDTTAKQRDLDLLMRDKSLKDRQLDNRTLLREISVALGALLSLATLLGVVMVRKARFAHKALKAKESLLRAQSERDPLTDLANRRHFLAVMESMPQGQFHGALLMVDIDHFKHVNDEHGHAAGDAVICEVARRLTSAVRSADLVVRWGGEEFLVFVPVGGSEHVESLASRILESIGGSPIATPDGSLRVTASAGFARFPLGDKLSLNWEQAVNWVDLVLYNAKARGRNRAIGISAVHVPDAASLAKVEAEFDAACSAGLVTLREVAGPA